MIGAEVIIKFDVSGIEKLHAIQESIAELSSACADSKSTEALQFYEYYADLFNINIFGDTPIDKITSLGDMDWNMDELRAICRVGKGYSHSRFMNYVALRFGTTVSEMKSQWRNIKTNNNKR